MAEKGFGVKEVNLIGASGTPTITSPNNLNLNAVNVAISTNVSIGGTLTVTGNVSVGGTLTYEDVTNIDSVGLITARSGVVVGAGKSILVGAGVTISSSTKGDIQISGIATAHRFDIPYTGSGSGFSMEGGAYNNGYYINSTGSGSTLIGMAYFSNNTIGLSGNGSSPLAFVIDDVSTISLNPSSGACNLNYAGSGKLQTTNTGINVTGSVTATSFSGSGANLTGIAVTEAPVTDYTITGDGSHYYFHGGGVDETAGDPDLYLIRGQKYRFNNTTGSSHPFEFRVSSGGSAYSNGVSGDDEGVQFFTVPYDAPPSIVYQCTAHSGMVGNIYISGGQYHTRPNNLCLQYTRSSSNVTTGTVIYNTEVFDVGDSNAYNTSNGEFTAPVTGVYRIQFEHFSAGAGRATANIEKSSGGGWSVIKIGMRIYSQSAGSDWSSVPTIYYAQLNANDKIRITHREGTIHLNNPWNHLTIQLVQ